MSDNPIEPSKVPLTAEERRLLGVGHPDYEFPKEVHNLLMAANQTNMTLSEMADSKASILLGASFVVFSLSIGNLAEGKANVPMLVLTLFSFVATIFGVLTVRPNRMRKAKAPLSGKKVNILFFGSYIDCPREEYVDEVMRVLSSEEETYRRLARDLWDHGHILRNDKYRWLYWSFTFFLWGMVVTALAVAGQMLFDLF
ncbi:Pycsar system effector family protein [Sphingomonas mesophila]|uniref:Pycsar system effector family protein n=1 Tax=Sphingomonas mesophila TaxID=2303576 RepID=UPI000E575202|nr:Pycsar system effector family protein [Sphingomonas mesophila]